MKISGFKTYHLFLALRNHFYSNSYDFFRHRGKIKASEQSYLAKRDYIWYEQASRHYTKEELQDLILSNLIVGRIWFINIVHDEVDEAERVWKEYVKRRENFSYAFSQDLDKLLEFVEEPKDIFHAPKGQYPEIIIQFLNKNVALETLSALDVFVDFSNTFDKKYGKDDVIWSSIRKLVVKYKPFLTCDFQKINKIIREKLLNNASQS